MSEKKKKEKTEFQILCENLEHWETPQWAVEAVLKREILTQIVLDPCAGTGILAEAAKKAGYDVRAQDIHNWGYPLDVENDFLFSSYIPTDVSVLMNPPFSLAEKFVDKAWYLGARKIVCFQRFSWFEGSYDKGKKRGQWWEKNKPARIWICGDRADCWRHDIRIDQRTSSTPTAHAWFVWERGHSGTQLGHIYKS